LANAGFEVTGIFDKLTIEDYRRQFETNVFGVLRTAFATLKDLKKTRGCLVLIGSLLGHIVLPATTAYSMSKFAVTALAEGLRRELRPYGISVVLITPGNVETEIRKIDNYDVLHRQLNDPIPEWLRIRADQAARKIVAAVVRHRPEAVITKIGKLAVFTERHVPELVSLAIDVGHLRGRSEPSGAKRPSRSKRAPKEPDV
jgi:short-subunit dehydrogenase